MKVFRTFGIAVLALLAWSSLASAQRPLRRNMDTSDPGLYSCAGGHPMLLTDGSVLILNNTCNTTGNWYRLVPDSTGSYRNGSWVSAGNLPAGYNPFTSPPESCPTDTF